MKDGSSEVFTLQNKIQTSKVKSLVAEIEDRGQGSQEDGLRRGWGRNFSFVKLLDGEDLFQKSESPSKRRRILSSIASSRQPQTERSLTTPSPSCAASRPTPTVPTPPPATGDTLVGGESSMTDTRRWTALTMSQGTTWGRRRTTRSLCRSGQPDHQSDHMGIGGEGS